VAAVRRAVRRWLADVEPGATVVVACSGGADSLALLAATVFEGDKAGWHVVGATVDHGLQEASAARAERIVAQMVALGAAETVSSRVEVSGGGLGPEAALADLGDSLSVVALATHPDAVRRRVLRLAALAAGSPASELFHEHVMAMDALITDWHGQRWVDLPGHLRFLRREGLLGFERA
jgi:hypothetical protein